MFLERTLALINEAGINKYKLTTDLKISKNSFVDWEKGRSPKHETIDKIAEYFNVSTDYLLGKTNIKNPAEIDEVLRNPKIIELLAMYEKMSDEQLDKILDYAQLLVKKQ